MENIPYPLIKEEKSLEEKRFAVLIDSDNISQKYCEYILDEVAEYGIATYKRIYGDWTSSRNGWKDMLLKYSITPMQQYSYTTGKNATDSAMIIDAMDILYTNHVDGFCIVTSDSDFTKLASRLRESGMMVIGMGEKKTPEPFRVACDKFVYLDVLANEDDQAEDTENSRTREVIEKAIIKIISDNEDRSKKTGIGEIGSRLSKLYSDFDVRNYGYSKLSTFLESFSSIRLEKNNSSCFAVMNEQEMPKSVVGHEICKILEGCTKKSMNMGQLSQLLQDMPGFQIRNYGYTKFTKFFSSFSELKVEGMNVRLKK